MKQIALLLGLCLGLTALPGYPQADNASGGLNQLGLDLLRTALPAENSCCSPLSVGSTLALTCMGAQGETADQLSHGLSLSCSQVGPAYSGLIQGLEGVPITCASRLWSQAEPLPAFRKTAQETLKADCVRQSFRPAGVACQAINGWVKTATSGLVPTLVNESDLDPATELVVTNAVCFKGAWSQPFDPKLTEQLPFHAGEQQFSVPTMHRQVGVMAGEGQGFELVCVPYNPRRLHLVVLLPAPGKSLGEVERSLTLQRLNEGFANLEMANADLYLPRFKLNCRTDLTAPLRTLTGPVPFSAQADMSRALGPAGVGLGIDKVVQVTCLSTDEEGTVAAAGTAAMSVRDMPRVIRVDRPFLFMVRDGTTGAFLFMGRVTDPRRT